MNRKNWLAKRSAIAVQRALSRQDGRVRAAAPLVMLALAGSAIAAPEGERVVAGDASFSRQGATTVIHADHNTIIDYSSFNIASGETVRFVQPNSGARVLNRVRGPATRIDGTLTANGQVYIVNQAGIFFGDRAVVSAGRVYAAAARITNDDFLSGRDRFTGAVGKVENRGTIRGDRVHLFGRSVSNYGTIVSPQGVVTMHAGRDLLIGEQGGNVFVRVDGAADAQQGQTDAGVVQAGRIDTGGGRVMIGAGDLYSLAIRPESSIRASSVRIEGGAGSTVWASGVIDVSDSMPGEALASATTGGTVGGEVFLLGDRVAVADAMIDASGEAGGGTVLVGGDYQGLNTEVRNATATWVGSDAVIDVSATVDGYGGTAILWSDHVTRFFGEIKARGGEHGGDGGFVEVSGKEYLRYEGITDTLAKRGESGTLLLDPGVIRFRNGGSDDPSLPAGPADINVDFSVDGTEEFDITKATLATFTGDVVLQATHRIEAQAGGADLVLNAGLTSLTLETRNQTSDQTDAGAAVDTGGIFLADVAIDGTAGNTNIVLRAGTVGDETVQIQTGAISTGSGNITLDTTNLGTVTGGATGGITLGGALTTTGAIDIDARSLIEVASQANIGLGSASVDIRSINGTINFAGDAVDSTTLTGAGTLSLNAGGNINFNDNVTLELLTGSALASIDADGFIRFNDGSALTLNANASGAVFTSTSATNGIELNTGSTVTLNDAAVLTLDAASDVLVDTEISLGTVSLFAGNDLTINQSVSGSLASAIIAVADNDGDGTGQLTIDTDTNAGAIGQAGNLGGITIRGASFDLDAGTVVGGAGTTVTVETSTVSQGIAINSTPGGGVAEISTGWFSQNGGMTQLVIGRADGTGDVDVSNLAGINTPTLVRAGGAGGSVTLGSFNLNSAFEASASSIALGGDITSNNDDSITLTGAVDISVAGAITLDTDATDDGGGGAITITGDLNAALADLVLDAGDQAITLGNGAAVNSLSLTGSDLNLAGSLAASSVDFGSLSGGIVLTGNASINTAGQLLTIAPALTSLGADEFTLSLTGAGVTLGSAIVANEISTLTIDGTGGNVDLAGVDLGTLVLDGGSDLILRGDVTTTDGFSDASLAGNLQLAAATVAIDAGAGSVNITRAVIDDGTDRDLTLVGNGVTVSGGIASGNVGALLITSQDGALVDQAITLNAVAIDVGSLTLDGSQLNLGTSLVVGTSPSFAALSGDVVLTADAAVDAGGNALVIDSDIVGGGNGLALTAAGITLNGSATGLGNIELASGAGDIALAQGVDGTSLSLTSGAGLTLGGSVTLSGGGFDTTNLTGDLTLDASAITIGAGTEAVTISANIVGGGNSLTVNAGDVDLFSVSGLGALDVNAGGVVSLGGAIQATGAITVDGSTIGTVAGATIDTTSASGVSLFGDDGVTIGATISAGGTSAGPVVIDADANNDSLGTLTVDAQVGRAALDSTITLSGASIDLNASVLTGGSNALELLASDTLDIGAVTVGDASLDGTLTLRAETLTLDAAAQLQGSAAATLAIEPGQADTAIEISDAPAGAGFAVNPGTIAGAFSTVAIGQVGGTHAVTVSGTSTFSSGVTINGGSLQLDGDLSAGGGLTIMPSVTVGANGLSITGDGVAFDLAITDGASDFDLTVDAGSGDAVFAGFVDLGGTLGVIQADAVVLSGGATLGELSIDDANELRTAGTFTIASALDIDSVENDAIDLTTGLTLVGNTTFDSQGFSITIDSTITSDASGPYELTLNGTGVVVTSAIAAGNVSVLGVDAGTGSISLGAVDVGAIALVGGDGLTLAGDIASDGFDTSALSGALTLGVGTVSITTGDSAINVTRSIVGGGNSLTLVGNGVTIAGGGAGIDTLSVTSQDSGLNVAGIVIGTDAATTTTTATLDLNGGTLGLAGTLESDSATSFANVTGIELLANAAIGSGSGSLTLDQAVTSQGAGTFDLELEGNSVAISAEIVSGEVGLLSLDADASASVLADVSAGTFALDAPTFELGAVLTTQQAGTIGLDGNDIGDSIAFTTLSLLNNNAGFAAPNATVNLVSAPTGAFDFAISGDSVSLPAIGAGTIENLSVTATTAATLEATDVTGLTFGGGGVFTFNGDVTVGSAFTTAGAGSLVLGADGLSIGSPGFGLVLDAPITSGQNAFDVTFDGSQITLVGDLAAGEVGTLNMTAAGGVGTNFIELAGSVNTAGLNLAGEELRLGDSITTSGSLTLGSGGSQVDISGDLVLSGDTTITTDGDLVIDATITSSTARALTLSGTSVTVGSVIGAGNVSTLSLQGGGALSLAGASVSALEVNATTLTLGGDLTVGSAFATNDGTNALNGLVLGSAVAIDTGANDLVIDVAITGDGAAQDLTFNAGAITLTGGIAEGNVSNLDLNASSLDVGGVYSLGSVAIDGLLGAVTLLDTTSIAVAGGGFELINAGNTVSSFGALHDLTISTGAGAIRLGGGVQDSSVATEAGVGQLVLNTTGAVAFGRSDVAGQTTIVDALTLGGAGAVTLSSDLDVRDGSTLSFGAASVALADIAGGLISITGTGEIDLSEATINATTTESLSVVTVGQLTMGVVGSATPPVGGGYDGSLDGADGGDVGTSGDDAGASDGNEDLIDPFDGSPAGTLSSIVLASTDSSVSLEGFVDASGDITINAADGVDSTADLGTLANAGAIVVNADTDMDGSGAVILQGVGTAGGTTGINLRGEAISLGGPLEATGAGGTIDLAASGGMVTFSGDLNAAADITIASTQGVSANAAAIGSVGHGGSIFIDGDTDNIGSGLVSVGGVGTAGGTTSVTINGSGLSLTGDVFGTGDVVLSARDGVNMSGSASVATSGHTGSISIDADTDADGIGGATLFAVGTALGTTDVSINAAQLDMQGVVSGTGELVATPSTDDRAILFQATAGGSPGFVVTADLIAPDFTVVRLGRAGPAASHAYLTTGDVDLSGSELDLRGASTLTTTGDLNVGGDFSLTGDGTVANIGGVLLAGGDINMDAVLNLNPGGQVIAGGGLVVGGDVSLVDGSVLQAGTDLTVAGGLSLSGGTVTLMSAAGGVSGDLLVTGGVTDTGSTTLALMGMAPSNGSATLGDVAAPGGSINAGELQFFGMRVITIANDVSVDRGVDFSDTTLGVRFLGDREFVVGADGNISFGLSGSAVSLSGQDDNSSVLFRTSGAGTVTLGPVVESIDGIGGFLQSLTVESDAGLELTGDVSVSGVVDFGSASQVTLNAGGLVTVDTTSALGGGADVLFADTSNIATDLVVFAGSGAIDFGGLAVDRVTMDTAAGLTIGGDWVIGTGGITLTGASDVMLNADITTGSDLDFTSMDTVTLGGIGDRTLDLTGQSLILGDVTGTVGLGIENALNVSLGGDIALAGQMLGVQADTIETVMGAITIDTFDSGSGVGGVVFDTTSGLTLGQDLSIVTGSGGFAHAGTVELASQVLDVRVASGTTEATFAGTIAGNAGSLLRLETAGDVRFGDAVTVGTLQIVNAGLLRTRDITTLDAATLDFSSTAGVRALNSGGETRFGSGGGIDFGTVLLAQDAGMGQVVLEANGDIAVGSLDSSIDSLTVTTAGNAFRSMGLIDISAGLLLNNVSMVTLDGLGGQAIGTSVTDVAIDSAGAVLVDGSIDAGGPVAITSQNGNVTTSAIGTGMVTTDITIEAANGDVMIGGTVLASSSFGVTSANALSVSGAIQTGDFAIGSVDAVTLFGDIDAANSFTLGTVGTITLAGSGDRRVTVGGSSELDLNGATLTGDGNTSALFEVDDLVLASVNGASALTGLVHQSMGGSTTLTGDVLVNGEIDLSSSASVLVDGLRTVSTVAANAGSGADIFLSDVLEGTNVPLNSLSINSGGADVSAGMIDLDSLDVQSRVLTLIDDLTVRDDLSFAGVTDSVQLVGSAGVFTASGRAIDFGGASLLGAQDLTFNAASVAFDLVGMNAGTSPASLSFGEVGTAVILRGDMTVDGPIDLRTNVAGIDLQGGVVIAVDATGGMDDALSFAELATTDASGLSVAGDADSALTFDAVTLESLELISGGQTTFNGSVITNATQDYTRVAAVDVNGSVSLTSAGDVLFDADTSLTGGDDLTITGVAVTLGTVGGMMGAGNPSSLTVNASVADLNGTVSVGSLGLGLSPTDGNLTVDASTINLNADVLVAGEVDLAANIGAVLSIASDVSIDTTANGTMTRNVSLPTIAGAMGGGLAVIGDGVLFNGVTMLENTLGVTAGELVFAQDVSAGGFTIMSSSLSVGGDIASATGLDLTGAGSSVTLLNTGTRSFTAGGDLSFAQSQTITTASGGGASFAIGMGDRLTLPTVTGLSSLTVAAGELGLGGDIGVAGDLDFSSNVDGVVADLDVTIDNRGSGGDTTLAVLTGQGVSFLGDGSTTLTLGEATNTMLAFGEQDIVLTGDLRPAQSLDFNSGGSITIAPDAGSTLTIAPGVGSPLLVIGDRRGIAFGAANSITGSGTLMLFGDSVDLFAVSGLDGLQVAAADLNLFGDLNTGADGLDLSQTATLIDANRRLTTAGTLSLASVTATSDNAGVRLESARTELGGNILLRGGDADLTGASEIVIASGLDVTIDTQSSNSTAMTPGSIDFGDSTILGPGSLTLDVFDETTLVSGSVNIDRRIGFEGEELLGSLTITAANIELPDVATSGAQTYHAMAPGASITFADFAGDDVDASFFSTIDADIEFDGGINDAARSLRTETGSGFTMFRRDVMLAGAEIIGNVSLGAQSGGMFDFVTVGSATFGNDTDPSSSGSQILLTTASDVFVQSMEGDLLFDGAVNGDADLAVLVERNPTGVPVDVDLPFGETTDIDILPTVRFAGSIGNTAALRSVRLNLARGEMPVTFDGSGGITGLNRLRTDVPRLATIVMGRLIGDGTVAGSLAGGYEIRANGDIMIGALEKLTAIGDLTIDSPSGRMGASLTQRFFIPDLTASGSISIGVVADLTPGITSNIVLLNREQGLIYGIVEGSNNESLFSPRGNDDQMDIVSGTGVSFGGARQLATPGGLIVLSSSNGIIPELNTPGLSQHVEFDGVMPELLVFVDPMGRVFFLDLRAQGLAESNLATALAGALPQASNDTQPVTESAVSLAQRQQLLQIGIFAKDEDPEDQLRRLLGILLFDDLPASPSPQLAQYEVSSARLSGDAVQRVLGVYNQLFGAEAVGFSLTTTEGERQQVIRREIAQAWSEHRATNPGGDAASFVDGLLSDADKARALSSLELLSELFGSIESLGLTDTETAISRSVLAQLVKPATMPAEFFDELMTLMRRDQPFFAADF